MHWFIDVVLQRERSSSDFSNFRNVSSYFSKSIKFLFYFPKKFSQLRCKYYCCLSCLNLFQHLLKNQVPRIGESLTVWTSRSMFMYVCFASKIRRALEKWAVGCRLTSVYDILLKEIDVNWKTNSDIHVPNFVTSRFMLIDTCLLLHFAIYFSLLPIVVHSNVQITDLTYRFAVHRNVKITFYHKIIHFLNEVTSIENHCRQSNTTTRETLQLQTIEVIFLLRNLSCIKQKIILIF